MWSGFPAGDIRCFSQSLRVRTGCWASLDQPLYSCFLQQSSPDRNILTLCLGPLLTPINRVLYLSGDCSIIEQLWLLEVLDYVDLKSASLETPRGYLRYVI